jgi:hypothetical protein
MTSCWLWLMRIQVKTLYIEPGSRGKMATTNRSMASCVMNYSTASCSTHWPKRNLELARPFNHQRSQANSLNADCIVGLYDGSCAVNALRNKEEWDIIGRGYRR